MGSVRCLIRYKTARVHVLDPLLTNNSLRTTGTLFSALSRARQKMTMDSKIETNTVPVGLTNAGKGRAKGVPNKVTKQLKDMILGALDDAGGQEYLVKQAMDNPNVFCALVGKILPMQVNAEVNATITHEDWLATLK